MWWFIALVVAGGIWYSWSRSKAQAEANQAEPYELPDERPDWLKQLGKQAAADSDARIGRELSDIQATAKRNQTNNRQ
jgi:hypothetical protein